MHNPASSWLHFLYDYPPFFMSSGLNPIHNLTRRILPRCKLQLPLGGLLLPLLRRKALWSPSMNGRNLNLQRRINQPMSRQCSLLLE